MLRQASLQLQKLQNIRLRECYHG